MQIALRNGSGLTKGISFHNLRARGKLRNNPNPEELDCLSQAESLNFYRQTSTCVLFLVDSLPGSSSVPEGGQQMTWAAFRRPRNG
jgi:hypothetical protein